jgi:hypothetical protein
MQFRLPGRPSRAKTSGAGSNLPKPLKFSENRRAQITGIARALKQNKIRHDPHFSLPSPLNKTVCHQ